MNVKLVSDFGYIKKIICYYLF